MEKSYETFVTDLRKLLLAAMDLREEEIFQTMEKNMAVWEIGYL